MTPPILDVLDRLAFIARMMDPRRLDALIGTLGDAEVLLAGADDRFADVAAYAGRACEALRAAPEADNPMIAAYRAMRDYHRALEAVARLEMAPDVGRWLLEPRFRDMTLPAAAHTDSGLFHSGNQTAERGGFSVYVPPGYDPARTWPVVFALHGGSGHGRLFLWNWLPEARSRGLIVVSPTAIGGTWSLMEPETDSANLARMLDQVRAKWNVDNTRVLLSGMSDGGTFTLLSGLMAESPFTHLAPAAASFHPLMLGMSEPGRLTGLPIHLTHGRLDWMFPVDRARLANQTLSAAGAAVVYREIADLSHAYPRDGQGEVMDWFLGA